MWRQEFTHSREKRVRPLRRAESQQDTGKDVENIVGHRDR
jgi:hypothetical protein